MSDRMNFTEALEAALSRSRDSIGTYKEKTLHHVLKLYYGGLYSTESPIGKYVADVVREDGIYEIQTRSFYRMADKLEAFLSVSPVTVVYPVVERKYISRTDTESGEIIARVRSPKKGKAMDILPELYSLRKILNHENLHFIIALVDCEEYRYADGFGRNKAKRATKVDLIPTTLNGEIYLNCSEDYRMFVPESLPRVFTSSEYRLATKFRPRDVGKALLVLTDLGILTRVGTEGRKILYSLADRSRAQDYK